MAGKDASVAFVKSLDGKSCMGSKTPQPEFSVSDWVEVIVNRRNRTPHLGIVRQVIWHQKDRRYNVYLGEMAGRFPNDIVLRT